MVMPNSVVQCSKWLISQMFERGLVSQNTLLNVEKLTRFDAFLIIFAFFKPEFLYEIFLPLSVSFDVKNIAFNFEVSKAVLQFFKR